MLGMARCHGGLVGAGTPDRGMTKRICSSVVVCRRSALLVSVKGWGELSAVRAQSCEGEGLMWWKAKVVGKKKNVEVR